MNVWDFGPLGTAIATKVLRETCTEIIFMKYKEEVQVTTTVNEFLRFNTNPSNQHYANYHETKATCEDL